MAGIGERPDDPVDAHAWAIFQDRIEEVGRRSRASAAARRRPDEPSAGARIAARTAENIHYRLLDFLFTDDGGREVVTAAAAAFADVALALVLDEEDPPEEWIGQIPAPDTEDEEQKAQWLQLVTALALWRMLHQTDSGDPLGESPDDAELRLQWTGLHDALTLFQRSRIQQRLSQIQARRDIEHLRRGLPPTNTAPPGQEGGSTRRARRTEEDEQQRQQHPGPTSGPRRGSGN